MYMYINSLVEHLGFHQAAGLDILKASANDKNNQIMDYCVNVTDGNNHHNKKSKYFLYAFYFILFYFILKVNGHTGTSKCLRLKLNPIKWCQVILLSQLQTQCVIQKL